MTQTNLKSEGDGLFMTHEKALEIISRFDAEGINYRIDVDGTIDFATVADQERGQAVIDEVVPKEEG